MRWLRQRSPPISEIDDRLLQHPGLQRLLRDGDLEQLADDALTTEITPAAKILNDNPEVCRSADSVRDASPAAPRCR
jgi:hypothetical protein